MIYIIDNGEGYSDHRIDFVEVGDVAEAEVIRLYPARCYIIARAESLDWRDEDAIDDIGGKVPADRLFALVEPAGWSEVTDDGRRQFNGPRYGDVRNDVTEFSRALLVRVFDNLSRPFDTKRANGSDEAKANIARANAERLAQATKLRAWLDAHPEHVEWRIGGDDE